MPDNIIQNVSIQGEGNIVVGKGDVIVNPIPPTETRLRHDLGILLKNVETTWIKGLLEKSVHQAALLELGLELRNEAVDNPWRMVMESPDQTRETVPQGKKIKDIFNEANRLLLILGEPGSGKTTTLLQLAKELIAEVDQTFTQPIPVILNLSTWASKQQPLDEWLISELNVRYRLPKRDGRKWLRDRRILPLLDGLDEVKAENRSLCVERINQLIDHYGLQGAVVCSRVKDYGELDIRLTFYRAVYIQPLTFEQVDEYLDKAGDNLKSLRITLRNDIALRTMAQSPLTLNIMSLTFQNSTSVDLDNLSSDTGEVRYQLLFNAYITKMFNRKVNIQKYDLELAKYWLSWLARQMQSNNQDLFLIEQLQPNWLTARLWQWLYFLVSRIVSGLLIMIIIDIVTGGKLVWQVLTSSALILGFTIGLVDILRSSWISNQTKLGKNTVLSRPIIYNIIVFFMTVLNFTLTLGIFYGLKSGFVTSLFFGIISLIFFSSKGRRQGLEKDVLTFEALRWSWSRALKSGVIVGLIFGAIGWLIGGMYNAITAGLNFGIFGILFGGMKQGVIENKSTPNQGIMLTIRNAIFAGLVVSLSVASVFLITKTSIDTNLLFTGSIASLAYGGLDVVQHYILRLILIIEGYMPLNYASFLDYVSERIILQKTGGGYQFIHRLLREHFANMGSTSKENNINF